jgi:hypothetical protein
MFPSRILVTAGILGALCGSARAEKVAMKPEVLGTIATHSVVGKVLAIYQRQETQGDYRITRYVAEIQVAACEKGGGLQKDDLVYARYWHRDWLGKEDMPPGTSGHRGLPAEGDTLRVYLARKAYDGFGDNLDMGFNVIGANGFQRAP